MRAIIAGTGGYLPERALSNEELAQAYGLDTSDEWIRERTGIRRRHIAAEGETASSMGAAAALRALEQAGIPAAEVDAVIVATSTPDSAFPSTAALVQAAIGGVVAAHRIDGERIGGHAARDGPFGHDRSRGAVVAQVRTAAFRASPACTTSRPS